MALPYHVLSDFMFAKADKAGIPLSGTFELTARCNLNCRMCYIHRKSNDSAAQKQERSSSDWLDLAAQCQKHGTLLLLLTGGEPLLRPDFREIYSGCKKLGLFLSINSNGSLIDDDTVRFFASDPPARVNISLYGVSPETYAALCDDASAYHRTVHAILALQKAGIPVKLNFSATPWNKDDLPAVFEFSRKHDLPLQVASYMFPPVRTCELGCCEPQRLSPTDAAALQITYDKLRFSPEELRRRWADQLKGLSAPEPESECQELPTERIRCRAGSSVFWVTYNWDLRPCGMMTTPSVSLMDMGFAQAWEEIHTARQQIITPAKCTSCPIRNTCDRCAAIYYAETGSYSEPAPYLCEKARAYLELAREQLPLLRDS